MSFLVVKGQACGPKDCGLCICSSHLSREDSTTSFKRRKKEAASQALIIRLTWIFLHVAIICCLFLLETDLSRAWHRLRLPYLVSYFLVLIANLALYVNLCISNPGYLQPGVHALSLSTMKRDAEGSLAIEDAAELGIGGLAHIDIPLIGRRNFLGAQQRDRQQKITLDRTTTLPNLPSQTPREALLDVSSPGRAWDESPASRNRTFEGVLGSPTSPFENASAAINEAKTESAAGILAPGDRAFSSSIPESTLSPPKASKVRVRGLSLGCEQELHSAMGQSGSDWLERAGDAAEPLLGKENHNSLCSGKPTALTRSSEDSGLHRKPSKPLSPMGSHDRRRALPWWEGPNPGRWCEYCGAWQLLRSRHCHDCGRCVRRFDHHCAWIGRCIGQDNHLMFWWYLFVQLMLLSWTTHIIVEGFELPVPLTAGRFVSLFVCCVPTVLLTGFVAMLLGYHTYLVLTAQTTYELVANGDTSGGLAKIPYLRQLPKGVCPFSHGPTQNILHFCCDRTGSSYQMPAALAAGGKHGEV